MADAVNPMPGMEVAVNADVPSAKVEISVQEDGGYYTPSVSEGGELRWIPSSTGMPAVAPANVRGPAGADGQDGHTPVKGVDYFTDADKNELVQAVLIALPAAEGGSY